MVRWHPAFWLLNPVPSLGGGSGEKRPHYTYVLFSVLQRTYLFTSSQLFCSMMRVRTHAYRQIILLHFSDHLIIRNPLSLVSSSAVVAFHRIQ